MKHMGLKGYIMTYPKRINPKQIYIHTFFNDVSNRYTYYLEIIPNPKGVELTKKKENIFKKIIEAYNRVVYYSESTAFDRKFLESPFEYNTNIFERILNRRKRYVQKLIDIYNKMED